MNTEIRQLLEDVRSGARSVDEALLELKKAPFAELGYAKVDLHRRLRQGAVEVIYGAGKTPEQIAGILRVMQANGQSRVLITRLDAEKAAALGRDFPLRYEAAPRVAMLGEPPEPDGLGTVVVATGGTSDLPVAEEAALTAEFLGSRVTRLYDVGVAGLHRILAHLDELMGASVVVAIAGMEGALASVLGGLVDCPVIAVPTSVGYGASFGGLSALLSMLNSCASGVSVVNIDNGFGAGFLANRINHMGGKT
ncbi:MAG: nickel pincer cofactor biosynthesis protein LarB [Oscillospiraceae bacterium]|nr:nickel pincer cofactor biosynthesis protein LarB [Oscillospiraceae bacterium]